jgi:hypothetical protein
MIVDGKYLKICQLQCRVSHHHPITKHFFGEALGKDQEQAKSILKNVKSNNFVLLWGVSRFTRWFWCEMFSFLLTIHA